MKQARKIMIMLVILLSCVGCDQVTKNIARQNLANGEPLSFLGNIFRLQYTENPGAFLSLGAGVAEEVRFLIFTALTGLFLAGMISYLVFSRKAGKTEVMAISLVAGGGIANLMDRVFNHGRVIDFMNMGIGPVRTGIFNVADIAITFGTLWLFVLLARKPEIRKNAGE